jgi:Zn-dependent peptidase ImmA (M78 family)/transcriptional regulator with XRE-family HTH domain
MTSVAASIPALVEPAVLRWARETIGLSEVAAARKLGLPDDRVARWESGEAQPTIVQLRKAAEIYNRALGVFFLASPPADFDTLRDFRRVEGSPEGEWSPDLHREYRRALAQRTNILELFELEDTQPATGWRILIAKGDDTTLATTARATLLRISPLPFPRPGGTPYQHLNTWVSALEEAGVLVMATAGGRVSVTEMRAFSLYYDQLPVVVVNGSDSPRGRLFSLLHEYAHLLLHTGGLCDLVTDTKATSPNRALEARCNALAADILMPARAVLAQPDVVARRQHPTSWDYPALRTAAAPYGVSAEAFLRRLVTLGQVDMAFYQARRTEFLAAYEADEAKTGPGGGNWYRTTARDLGKGYVRHVTGAHRRRVINSYTAASYLNVKVGQLDRLAAAAAVQEAV